MPSSPDFKILTDNGISKAAALSRSTCLNQPFNADWLGIAPQCCRNVSVPSPVPPTAKTKKGDTEALSSIEGRPPASPGHGHKKKQIGEKFMNKRLRASRPALKGGRKRVKEVSCPARHKQAPVAKTKASQPALKGDAEPTVQHWTSIGGRPLRSRREDF